MSSQHCLINRMSPVSSVSQPFCPGDHLTLTLTASVAPVTRWSLSEGARPHPRAAPSPSPMHQTRLLSSASLFLSWLHPCLTQARILASGLPGAPVGGHWPGPGGRGQLQPRHDTCTRPGSGEREREREAPTLATIITIKKIVSFSDLDVVRKQKEARPGALRD